MKLVMLSTFVLVGMLLPDATMGFGVRKLPVRVSSLIATAATSTTAAGITTFDDLTEPEQRIYSLVEELHKSLFSFRVIVVGNGAILETTSVLGPAMKLNRSPQTGNAILTLASQDQSFEFHIQTSQVSKVVLTEKETTSAVVASAGSDKHGGERTTRVLRVIRFLNTVGAPMFSLILNNDSDKAIAWYAKLRDTYGEDMQL